MPRIPAMPIEMSRRFTSTREYAPPGAAALRALPRGKYASASAFYVYDVITMMLPIFFFFADAFIDYDAAALLADAASAIQRCHAIDADVLPQLFDLSALMLMLPPMPRTLPPIFIAAIIFSFTLI